MSEELSIILELEPDNPCNTTITESQSGEILYTIKTEHDKEKTFTYIRNAGGSVIASSEWRDVRSDIITLGQSKPVASSAWLKKSMVPFKDTVYFKDADQNDLKWKGNGPGMSLELYKHEDKVNPIARFLPSRRTLNKTTTPPTTEMTIPSIMLDGRGNQIRDLIVISFCFLEKSRRARESSTLNRAEGSGVLGAGLGG